MPPASLTRLRLPDTSSPRWGRVSRASTPPERLPDRLELGRRVGARAVEFAAAAIPVAGVAGVALDRMERGTGSLSAVDEVRQQMGLPVVSIANLDDVVEFLGRDPAMAGSLSAVRDYRERYGSR